MARKPNQSPKSISSSKKFTTMPPKAKPEAIKKPVQIVLPESVKPTEAPVTPVVTASATAVADAPVVQTTAAGVAETPAVKPGIAPLLAALNDVDADIAREAATSLGNLGDTAAVEPLIAILNDNNGYYHSVVRSAAAVSLGQLKDRRAVEALLAAVNDDVADTSSEAIRSLTTLADPRAVAALIAVVRNENGFFVNSVRRAAVLGLVELGGYAALSELRFVADNENEDSVIRAEAAEAVQSH